MKYIFGRGYIILYSLILCIACNGKDIETKIKLNSKEYKGQDIFVRMACNACHSINGDLKLGPTMKNQYGKEIRHTNGIVKLIDDAYLRESIIYPLKHIVEGYTPIMPSYKPILSEEDLDNLILYIKSLK